MTGKTGRLVDMLGADTKADLRSDAILGGVVSFAMWLVVWLLGFVWEDISIWMAVFAAGFWMTIFWLSCALAVKKVFPSLIMVLGVALCVVSLSMHGAGAAGAQDDPILVVLPEQTAWQEQRGETQPSVVPPEQTTWQECADEALVGSMAKAHVLEDTEAILTLNHGLAVCDREFPEGAMP